MDKEYSKGQRLLITTNEGVLEGLFHGMDDDHTRLSLDDIITHPAEERVSGLVTFYRKEIFDIRVVVPDADAEKEKVIPEDTLLMNNQIMLPYTKMPEIKPVHKRVHPRSETGGRTHRLKDSDYAAYSAMLSSFVYIKDLKDCAEPLKIIPLSHTISLACEGIQNGRRGKIRLVGIGTLDKVYVFDIVQLGPGLFAEGLQSILENPKIRKVMHDCKNASDAFYFLHKIELNNVYDTQAMDFLIRKKKTGRDPENGACLPWCLQKYLYLPDEFVFVERTRQGFEDVDDKRWSVRPLGQELVSCFVKKVTFLLPLFDNFEKTLLSDVVQGSAINLNVRYFSDEQYEEMKELDIRYLPQKMRGLALVENLEKDKVDFRVPKHKDDRKKHETSNGMQKEDKRNCETGQSVYTGYKENQRGEAQMNGKPNYERPKFYQENCIWDQRRETSKPVQNKKSEKVGSSDCIEYKLTNHTNYKFRLG